MQRLLKLQHHRHTAKRLPHKHTSYRGLFVVVFIFGFSLILMQRTGALDLTVTAQVWAPIPSGPAVINSPADGSIYTASPVVEVQGTCPAVTSGPLVASLWRATTMLGSAPCVSNGPFSIFITLSPGLNTITPKINNSTNNYGPDGTAVNYTYSPPEPPSSGGGGTGSGSGNNGGGGGQISTGDGSEGFYAVITGPTESETFITYEPNKPTEITIDIGGGTLDYAIEIDWGDGQVETWPISKDGKTLFNHNYKTSGSHKIKIKMTDSAGKIIIMNYTAISHTSQTIASGGNSTGSIGSLSGVFGVGLNSKSIWTMYLVILLVLFGFWALQVYERGLLMRKLSYARISKHPVSRPKRRLAKNSKRRS